MKKNYFTFFILLSFLSAGCSEEAPLGPQAPQGPENLSATLLSALDIELAWSDMANNETGYEIVRSMTSGSGFSLLSTLPANATSFIDQNLNPLINYFYKVRAFNTAGQSSYTPEVSQTTGGTVVSENGGIVLTFDDHFVHEWYQADSLLRKYNWKATFSICCVGSFTDDKTTKLLALKNAGHEIAHHSVKHKNALEFIAAFGSDEYIQQEILPLNQWFSDKGLTSLSFAYPFGKRNDETDSLLFDFFDIQRGVGTALYWKPIADHNCFFDNSPLVYGICIDESQSYFKEREYIQYITDLLTHARDNNKILILLAHQTVDTITDIYQTKISTLVYVCNYVSNNNMKYYTMSELKEMIHDSSQSTRLAAEKEAVE